jgi:hypothetical protein
MHEIMMCSLLLQHLLRNVQEIIKIRYMGIKYIFNVYCYIIYYDAMTKQFLSIKSGCYNKHRF